MGGVEERNETIIRRWMEEGWNGRNVDLIDELFAPNFIAKGGAHGEIGIDDYRVYVRLLMHAFPDLNGKILDVVTAGEFVVIRIRVTGTYSHEVQGVAPSGSAIDVEIVDLWQISDGLIQTRVSAQFDRLELESAIGTEIVFKPEFA